MNKITFEDYASHIKKIWKKNTANSHSNVLVKSIDQLNEIRHVFNTLTVGESFVFIININSGQFEYISPEAETVLGYKISDITIELCMAMVHPDDVNYVMAIHEQIANFSSNITPKERTNYKFNFDFRIVDPKKNIKQVHVQYFFFEHNKNFLPINSFYLATDISQIKMGGIPSLTIYQLNEGLNNVLNGKYENLILTKKEREIVDYLVKGYTSSDISEVLNLSKHTVDTHRRNILKKNNCSNTTELFSLFLKEKKASR